eukprot:TRINITY_DN47023_c0_g1_i1.p2 TRINITY_DN47023_c0_g1~~TRINITY_DN47023_c0_g1_i1.p2  ORF type:complete len:200 (+),score=55.88 TRINITY_DN47023_c0_g1_i1:85-600(+)
MPGRGGRHRHGHGGKPHMAAAASGPELEPAIQSLSQVVGDQQAVSQLQCGVVLKQQQAGSLLHCSIAPSLQLRTAALRAIVSQACQLEQLADCPNARGQLAELQKRLAGMGGGGPPAPPAPTTTGGAGAAPPVALPLAAGTTGKLPQAAPAAAPKKLNPLAKEWRPSFGGD